MADRPRVAFLGIGRMGAPQARRLLKAGFPLTAWNRTRAKAEALEDEGALVAGSPAEAVEGAEVVITMLDDGPAVVDVLFNQGAAAEVAPGAVVVDMSSIRPDEAREHERRLGEQQVLHLDAPVSGGTVGAEQGTLAIMCGGSEEAYNKALPALEAMGRPTHVGPSGAGQLAKLANQVIVGVTIGAVAEALALAAKGGADPAKVREALRGGFAESRILELHGERMVTRDFEPRGRASLHLKDMTNALAAAEAAGLSETPYSALTAELFRGLIDNAGDFDHSALLLELERLNGVKEA